MGIIKKENMVRKINLIVTAIFILFTLAPKNLGAFYLPTGEGSNTTINASGLDQFKLPVIASENTLPPAEQIANLINTLRDPEASEDEKRKVLGRLYQIILDKTIEPALKETLAGDLLDILRDSILSESLNAKIPFLLRDIALNLDISQATQQTIAVTLIDLLNTDLTFEVKKKILGVIYYLISAKETQDRFLIPVSLIDKMSEVLSYLSLAKDAKGNFLLPANVREMLSEVLSDLALAKENQKALFLSSYLKESLLKILSYLSLAKDAKGNFIIPIEMRQKLSEVISDLKSSRNTKGDFLIPAAIKEEMADLLIDALNDFNLDTNLENADTLKGIIVYRLEEIVLIPAVNQEKKLAVVNNLMGHLVDEGFSDRVKKYIIHTFQNLILNNRKYTKDNFIVSSVLKEEMVNKLLNLDILNNASVSDAVKEKVIALFGDIISISNIGTEKKEAATQYLLNLNIFDNLNLSDNIKGKIIALFGNVVSISKVSKEKKMALVQYLINLPDGLAEALNDIVYKTLRSIGANKNVDIEIRKVVLNKFLAIYLNNSTELSQRELIASYIVSIGRADAALKNEIALRLNLTAKQKDIWNKFNILALNTARNFSVEELNYIYNVLDKLSSDKLKSIINTLSLFSATNSENGTSGWREGGIVGIRENLYDPTNVNGFIKFICHEIAEAVYSNLLRESNKEEFNDIDDFSGLFERYITDSLALINDAKTQAATGDEALLKKVKIIIQVFDFTQNNTTMAYTFKIENGQIQRNQVNLGLDGLPK